MKITYKEIAEMTNKTEGAIKKMKTGNPEQLELLKLGGLCKKYNINIFDEKIVKTKGEIKNDNNI